MVEKNKIEINGKTFEFSFEVKKGILGYNETMTKIPWFEYIKLEKGDVIVYVENNKPLIFYELEYDSKLYYSDDCCHEVTCAYLKRGGTHNVEEIQLTHFASKNDDDEIYYNPNSIFYSGSEERLNCKKLNDQGINVKIVIAGPN